MSKKVVIVHTSLVSHAELNSLFHKIIPEATVQNIVDDSLLQEVKTVGHITPNIVARMCKYYQNAEMIGADLIFNQCSSVGEAAEIAAKTVNVPVLRVDRAMAEKAVQMGKRIAVVATVASTVEPSCNIVRRAAADAGRDCEIIPYLVDGAMDILMKEGPEKHNKFVLEMLKKCEQDVDVIVLAQGSMTALIPELGVIRKPVLTSPELGVRMARKLLFPEEGK